VPIAEPGRVACPRDHDLLREVRSLLDAHDRAEDFLEVPALESAARSYGREQLSWACVESLKNAGTDRPGALTNLG